MHHSIHPELFSRKLTHRRMSPWVDNVEKKQSKQKHHQDIMLFYLLIAFVLLNFLLIVKYVEICYMQTICKCR